MTLLFCLAQAMAAADAGAFLISPFVGRILDWHVKNEGRKFEPEDDPGVKSVRSDLCGVQDARDQDGRDGGVVSVRGEVEALAGCDRLTISPALLEELNKDMGTLPRRLSPEKPGDAAADSRRWMSARSAGR